MPEVFVGIGSNLDRERNIRSAIRRLGERFDSLRQSHIYESPAEGFDGPPFYNLVVGFETDLALDALVGVLKAIEAEHGRGDAQRGMRSRNLDLDLLLYGELYGSQAPVELPASDILRYVFVCVPLAELIPDWVHPATGETLASACESLSGRAVLRRVTVDD